MKRAVCALILLLPGAGIAAPAHETFDLKVHAYCIPPAFPVAGGKVCGFDTEDKLRERVLYRVFQLNQRFCPAGITFRHVSTEIVYDLWHSLTSEAWGAVDPNDTNFLGGQSIRFLREQLSDEDRKSVHIFILHQMTKGFAANPLNQEFYPGEYQGIFIGPRFEGGAWAHEMGHQFGLAHTFTWNDGFGQPDRDEDNIDCTSEDPGPLEEFDPNDGANDDKWSGALRSGYEYCQTTVVVGTDAGSTKPDYCTLQCWRNFDFVTGPLVLSDMPPIDNIMTYYGDLCHGPYVLNSIPHPAVCNDQIGIMRDVRQNEPVRKKLREVCENAGGDSDCDGVCQQDDKCPGTPDVAQTDGDGDGTPDACDLCPDDPDPTGDIDGDGIGDACDPDIDNDGCPQACPQICGAGGICKNDPNCPGPDLHPKDDSMVAGTVYHLGCDVSKADYVVFEKEDSDGDHVLNCADPDDDDDGVPDEMDVCPVHAGLGCKEMSGAPCTEIPSWSATCRFGDCNEFFVQLVEAVNPDPTLLATFTDVQAVDQTLYLRSLQGKTLSETAALFRPRDRERLALDLVDRDGRAQARIAEWGAEDLDLGDLTTGELMALHVPEPGRGPLVVRSSWAVGSPAGAMTADGDRDGVPDASDNCSVVANPLQDDADRDRFGDACDADLDGDLRVTEADVLAVAACLGTDLQSIPPLQCTVGESRPVSTEPTNAPPRAACTAADLDADGLVSERDLELARDALGQEPGPSGKRFGDRR